MFKSEDEDLEDEEWYTDLRNAENEIERNIIMSESVVPCKHCVAL